MDMLPTEALWIIADYIMVPKDYCNLLVLSIKWHDVMIRRRKKDMLRIGTENETGHILPNGHPHGLHEGNLGPSRTSLSWHNFSGYAVRAKFDNGRSYGTIRIWHGNNNIEIIGKCKDGKLEGTWMRYRANGEVCEISNMKDGLPDGTLTALDKSGSLRRLWTVKNCCLEGIQVKGNVHRRHGLYQKEWYLNGIEEGICIQYDNTRLLGCRVYHYGELVREDEHAGRWSGHLTRTAFIDSLPSKKQAYTATVRPEIFLSYDSCWMVFDIFQWNIPSER